MREFKVELDFTGKLILCVEAEDEKDAMVQIYNELHLGDLNLEKENPVFCKEFDDLQFGQPTVSNYD